MLEDAHQIHQRDQQLSLQVLAFVQRTIRLRPDVRLELLLLIKQLRRALELFVLHEAMNQLGARVCLLFRTRQRIGRQKHLGLDQDQRRGHVDEIGGDIDIELFELVQIFQILARDLGDGNIVNVHLLLADQIQQQVERAIVGIEMNFVGSGHRYPPPRSSPMCQTALSKQKQIPRGAPKADSSE